jgi:hypothetical protein
MKPIYPYFFRLLTPRPAAWLPLLLLGSAVQMQAQVPVQVVRGEITDKESRAKLTGATISIADVPGQGTQTDVAGRFRIEKVPVGKHTLRITYLGYQTLTIPNVLVTSGKEVVLNLEMEELVKQTKEVVISAKTDNRMSAANEMTTVSARSFDVAETERYAGSRQDPARMASNFAGVQGADDSRNDIIVRGNSPSGLLWRLEDIDIPNPNHFAVAGTSGGPVTILNNKTLSNSDFLTGAFPGEYGNTVAGVFDLKMRNGNSEKYEVSAQLGILGTELAAEGPISRKKGSSFLFTYRYSTLRLFQGLNIKIGTSSVPNYQDAALRLNFPVTDKFNVSLWGIGGLSQIDLIVSTLTERPNEIYGENDRDQYFKSNTGAAGITLQYAINSKTYSKLVIGMTGQGSSAIHDKVYRNANYQVDSIRRILGYNFGNSNILAHWYINHKLNNRTTVKFGVLNNLIHSNLIDSSRQYSKEWQHRWNYAGYTNLLQAYAEARHKFTDALLLSVGLHAQYLFLNQSASLEPRAGLRWTVAPNNTLSLGYGLHSQMQPVYTYYAHYPTAPATEMHNLDMGFTRSHHFVAGYDTRLGPSFRMRAEVYYQYLFNVPIDTLPGSSFTMLNQGATFSRVFANNLVNKGTGYNTGVELTLEKFFSHGYYFMFTGSLFDSKAKGNDGVYRSTDYNANYSANLLGGYELNLNPKNTLIFGGKVTYAGGRRYSPVNINASVAYGDIVVVEDQRNNLQFPDYFRADLKLGYRLNAKRVTHEISLDLVNIFNTRNVLNLTYDADQAAQGNYPFYKEYQLGFLPLFYYRLDFGW